MPYRIWLQVYYANLHINAGREIWTPVRDLLQGKAFWKDPVIPDYTMPATTNLLLMNTKLVIGGLGGIWTHDLLVANELLFRVELRAHESRQQDLNLQPDAYKATALPLCYDGVIP